MAAVGKDSFDVFYHSGIVKYGILDEGSVQQASNLNLKFLLNCGFCTLWLSFKGTYRTSPLSSDWSIEVNDPVQMNKMSVLMGIGGFATMLQSQKIRNS